MTNLRKPKEEKSNFLQVGQTVECGNCFPKKYSHCRNFDIYKKCDCICHSHQEEKCKHDEINIYCRNCPAAWQDWNPKLQVRQDTIKEISKLMEGYNFDIEYLAKWDEFKFKSGKLGEGEK